ncbi:MAG: SprT family zinc-dependent metalloprotease [Methylophilaceae bacterium]
MSAYVLELPDGDTIPYHLKRRPRKTVGMRISADGLIVHAPLRISQSQLEQLLLSKAGWIRNKLEARQEHAVEPMHWHDGAALMLLGNDVTLSIKQDARSRNVECLAGILYVALPTPDDQAVIARKVLQWYRKQAMTDFSRRLELLSAKLGVATPKLFLSNAQTRWGSCNSKKEVRLNWRLIQAPPHIINYVTAHELAHLKQMNHSAKFWAVVESIFPDYKKAEAELKTLSAQLHAMD